MALNIKTFSDFFNMVVGKFQKELPDIDPTIDASLAKSVAASSAIAGYGLQDGLKDAVNQSFWQTADDEFLTLFGNYDQVYRYDPIKSMGYAATNGTTGTILPQNTIISSGDLSYIAIADAIVRDYTDSITLTYTGGIVTAITNSIHSLSSGIELAISGATQTDYNGTFIITVLSATSFTYELTAGTLTSDTGIYTGTYVLCQFEAMEAGQIYNLSSGASLDLQITNIDSTIYVGYDGFSGGENQENIEDFRTREGEAHSTTPGLTTNPSLTYSAKKISGNTRVYIIRARSDGGIGTKNTAGYIPQLGETVMYILRDNDASIIPSAATLVLTKQQILNDGNWSTILPEDNLMVLAPILDNQNFIFTSITPNTLTMQNAINAQLLTFFQDNADVGGTIKLQSITSFLDQIQDPITGDFLTDYTMTTPSADIVASSGHIYTLGTVTYT
jgi:uncharacterized phage protein gp47/JayE